MTPNKFSRFTQVSLGMVGQGVLIIIAIATIFAIFQAINHIWLARAISVGDLLLLFLYLEVMSMLDHYLGSGNLPVRYPLYIGIIALARYLVLDIAMFASLTPTARPNRNNYKLRDQDDFRSRNQPLCLNSTSPYNSQVSNRQSLALKNLGNGLTLAFA